MQIIEINEPDIRDEEAEIAVGIDFGTTNSLIAVSMNGNLMVVPDSLGQELVPSIISFDDREKKEFFVGAVNDNKRIILRSVKRLLAKSTTEIVSNPNLYNLCKDILDSNTDVPKIIFGTHEMRLPVVASKIFIHLKKQAEQYLQQKISKAVVSVPAYFDDAARGQVIIAAKIAGFDVMRLITEPTAAAYAYGLNKEIQGAYLVYDLGGGTFDVSVLNVETGILQVIATGGDSMLGGDDIDYLLAEHIAKMIRVEITQDLQICAKILKEAVVEHGFGKAEYCGNNVEITLDQFNEIISSIITKTVQVAKEVHIETDQIKLGGIVLVGGSTRIPLITSELEKAFGVKVFSDIDPDRAVVLGAALQANNLSNKFDTLLIDALPLSLGIELYGGLVEKIILKNTPVPFAIKKQFTTHLDNQTGMQFHILQGEREMVADCRSLAKFELQNLPKAKAGTVKVEVTFAIDSDGILAVTAMETETGITQNMEIKPSFGLSKDEINAALLEAYKNADLDHHNKLLLEAKIEAENLIDNLLVAMSKTPDVLTNREQ
jgi:molecular chaperone HscA